jgi:hypothetical protein
MLGPVNCIMVVAYPLGFCHPSIFLGCYTIEKARFSLKHSKQPVNHRLEVGSESQWYIDVVYDQDTAGDTIFYVYLGFCKAHYPLNQIYVGRVTGAKQDPTLNRGWRCYRRSWCTALISMSNDHENKVSVGLFEDKVKFWWFIIISQLKSQFEEYTTSS